MFQVSMTIADTHIHAAGLTGEEEPLSAIKGKGGYLVKVFAMGIRTGHVHTARMTESDITTLVAVALAGEDFDLPARMVKRAYELVADWPNECKPIP